MSTRNGALLFFLKKESKINMWQINGDSIYISDVKTGNLIRQVYNPENINNIVQFGNDFAGFNKQHEIFLIHNEQVSPLFSIAEPVPVF